MSEELVLSDSFTLLSMVYYLFFCVNSLTHQSITTMFSASQVMGHVSELLQMEEHEKTHSEKIVEGEPAIDIKNGEYSWGFERKNSNDFQCIGWKSTRNSVQSVETSCLTNISVELMAQDLLVVVGKIGSGKTSFLQSIMDETEKMSGTHKVNGKIAYVEQKPFIFTGTISDNICFGLQYAECRFRKAVVAA